MATRSTTTRSRLTANQRAVLDALTTAYPNHLDVPRLALKVGTVPEGVSRTAGSLVRRGLVERVSLGSRVGYRLVDTREHNRGQALLDQARTAGLYATDPKGP